MDLFGDKTDSNYVENEDLFDDNTDSTDLNDVENEDLFNDNKDLTDLNDVQNERIGEIVCGKVGKYPWWPCMICHIKDDNKENKKKDNIFVRYFGRLEFSSINIRNIRPFEDFFLLQRNKKEEKRLKTYFNELNEVHKEAEYALAMNLEDRLRKYYIEYKTTERKSYPKKTSAGARIKKKVDNSTKPIIQKIVIKEELIYAFSQLDFPFRLQSSSKKCCRYCLVTDKNTVKCNVRKCMTFFHESCLTVFYNVSNMTFKSNTCCLECSMTYKPCCLCSETIRENEDKVECSMKLCNKTCHLSCFTDVNLSEMTRKTNDNKLICPRHLCHKCEFLNESYTCKSSMLIHCIMCIATYHNGDWCIPAGCFKLSERDIICPKHLPCGENSNSAIPPYVARVASNIQKKIFGNVKMYMTKVVKFDYKNKRTKHVNVNSCFKCGDVGDLICCETCPAAYHLKCVSITKEPEHFHCIDCVACNYHTYGEIILVKCKNYRWWPAQIMHYENVPHNILNITHKYGQFVVQFFGTREYCWTDQSRVFTFEKDDVSTLKKSCYSTYKESYDLAFEEAEKALIERECRWKNCPRDKTLRSRRYIHIKVNKRFGNLKKLKPFVINSYHKCVCKDICPKNDRDLYSSCLNVLSKYECHPDLCDKKEKCQNRNFVQRKYPRQEIFNTNQCGWGLKTKEFIHQNQFVNEYVGEIISNEEFERRQEWAKENNILDFYFMKLDNDRIIDARVYSNLSRFINHSCNPNLITESWHVHEDLRIGLFALRDIEAEEELTFNYNSVSQLKSFNMFPCMCGSEKCSGFLGPAPKNSNVPQNNLKKSKKSNVKSLANKENLNPDTYENICKGSMSTTLSTASMSTFKHIDKQCFRCSEDCDEQVDLSCSFEYCERIYHRFCLDLSQNPKYPWFCPWHFCDSCGVLSQHYCQFCIVSSCENHFQDYFFNEIDQDGTLACINHPEPDA